MADRITTIGTGGDYADPILWAAAEGVINDGDRAVGNILNNITMSALFRPNQAFPNGGLLKGNVTVTGEAGVGIELGNTAGTRICLSPTGGLDFEDIRFIQGANTYSIQNINNNNLTRVISAGLNITFSIAPLTPVFTNSVVDNIDLNTGNSSTLTLNNCLCLQRLIIRNNETLVIKNSISLAADWLLGRGTYAGSESLVNYCYILENAPASDFGAGSSNNTLNYDATSDLVNFAGGDYRTKSSSSLATAGEGGTFVGAFLESATGLTAAITESYADFSENISTSISVNLSVTITESHSDFSEIITASIAPSINVTASVTESYDDFTESVNVTITEPGVITANITESYANFTESISAEFNVNVSAQVTESYDDFTESISVAISKDIAVQITESYDDFSETINVSLPVVVTVNPRNTIRVKKQPNRVTIERTINTIRVK